MVIGVIQTVKAVALAASAYLIIGLPQGGREAHGQPRAGTKTRHRRTGAQVVEHVGRGLAGLPFAEIAAQGAYLMAGLDHPAHGRGLAQRITGYRLELLDAAVGFGRVGAQHGPFLVGVGPQGSRAAQDSAAHGQGRPPGGHAGRSQGRAPYRPAAHVGQLHAARPTRQHRAAKEVGGGGRQLEGALDAPQQDTKGDEAGSDVETDALLGRRRQQGDHDGGDDDADQGLDDQVEVLAQVGHQEGLGVDEEGKEHGNGHAQIEQQGRPGQHQIEKMLGNGRGDGE